MKTPLTTHGWQVPVLGQAILAATLYVATLATLLHEVAAAAGYLVS
jgi:hypothetical protein